MASNGEELEVWGSGKARRDFFTLCSTVPEASLCPTTTTVPADSSIELAGTSKLVLENGDYLQIQGGNSSGDLEAFASVLEIT